MASTPATIVPTPAPPPPTKHKGWIVGKRSRYFTYPYQGPSTEGTNIPDGFVFFHKGDADKAAAVLTEHNPVGFEVKGYPCV